MPIYRSTIHSKVKSFRPVGDRVLIRKVDKAQMAGVIHLPQKAVNTEAQEGIVVEVGPKVKLVKKGDTVFLPRQLTFQPVEMGGEILHIVPVEQLLAKVS